jgi:hypothetical protein
VQAAQSAFSNVAETAKPGRQHSRAMSHETPPPKASPLPGTQRASGGAQAHSYLLENIWTRRIRQGLQKFAQLSYNLDLAV